ncbi:MAG: DUF3788 domain-containing protein [Bacteroidetes bacterium]|nr:DUF3788 domain-containing protein [Bacteroidota bacterium]
MKSVFMQKAVVPSSHDLKKVLNDTFELWTQIVDFIKKKYPGAIEEWNYSGEKYGWSFRVKDKKRVLVYLLPRDKYFKVAFVFGQKAMNEIVNSNVSENIVNELKSAKVYAEGRGIRIEVNRKSIIPDIKRLVTIKIEN